MARKRSPFAFVAGLAWLDFVNTRPMRSGRPVDLLATPADVKGWLNEASRTYGWVRPGRGMGRSDALWREARKLRERLALLARRAARGQVLSHVALDAHLAAVRGSMRLAPEQGGAATLTFVPDLEAPAAALFPILRSAAEWLAAEHRATVKACGGPDCVLFFADTTKNQRRRWCSDASCGNRSRVSAFRKRERGGRTR